MAVSVTSVHSAVVLHAFRVRTERQAEAIELQADRVSAGDVARNVGHEHLETLSALTHEEAMSRRQFCQAICGATCGGAFASSVDHPETQPHLGSGL